MCELAGIHREACRKQVSHRPLLSYVLTGELNQLAKALTAEEEQERAKDRSYWAPLKSELEQLGTESSRSDNASHREPQGTLV
jgi:hypothetical protein